MRAAQLLRQRVPDRGVDSTDLTTSTRIGPVGSLGSNLQGRWGGGRMTCSAEATPLSTVLLGASAMATKRFLGGRSLAEMGRGEG